VYQLANELGISWMDIVDRLRELGYQVSKHHASGVDEEAADMLREYIRELRGEVLPPPETPPEVKEEEKPAPPVLTEMPAEEKSAPEEVIEYKPKKKKQESIKTPTAEALPKAKLCISYSLTPKELSQKICVPVNEIIKECMLKGCMYNINQPIDFDLLCEIASNYGIEIELEEKPEIETPKAKSIIDQPKEGEHLQPRPPVVTVMGHVDHGKTSLLDTIRRTNVTAEEAGGITQSIGAYQVQVKDKLITFIDTPGHEAFTAMRARGAKVTDIAILVIAADDGIMPQTIEALNHARAAGVPIIIAINKIDKPEANPELVKQQLAERGLIPEEWGGDTICVPVSAKKKWGIEELLEMIILVAEMLELKADPTVSALGTIIEARLDRHKGPVATVLIQQGTLRIGDVFIAGTVWGKVRAMLNEFGKKVKKAPPSTPVEILGLSELPVAGDILEVLNTEREAKEIIKNRLEQKIDKTTQRIGLEDVFHKIKEGLVKELRVIIKADTQGSVEALRQALTHLDNTEVSVKVIHAGVGSINESDIMLASASEAIIIGFNVRPEINISKIAEKEKVDIRFYRVIYHVIDDIKSAIKGMLEPEYKEILLGRAEVKAIFNIPKIGIVGGCYVFEGKITKKASVRVIRNGTVIYEGKIASLRRFKEDKQEVVSGFECGIRIDKFIGLQPEDIIEAYEIQEVPRELSYKG